MRRNEAREVVKKIAETATPHNRKERRALMKKYPAYRRAVKDAAASATLGLEEMFRDKWNDSETLNEGDREYNDWEDEEYID